MDSHDSTEAIETFRKAITPFLPTWQSIDIRAILDLAGGQVLSLVACLSLEPPGVLEEIQPTVQDILFTRGTLPISELQAFLDGWAAGTVEIGTRSFTTSTFSQREFLELVHPWDDVTSSWPELEEYRFLLLYATGPDIRQLTEPRNVEAIGRAWGFRSFSEMAHHRVQFRVGQDRRTRIEIFAPILANMEVSPKASEVSFTIYIHTEMEVADTSISYRLQDERGNRITGDRLALAELSPTSSGYFNTLEHTMQITQGVRSGEASLFHSRYHSGVEPVVTRLFVLPPVPGEANPRWDLIMSLVHNTRAFMGKRTEPAQVVKEDWLGLGLKRVDESLFRRGMSCLLFAAGFTQLSIGSEVEGVDEAIEIPEPNQLAILLSYTTGPDISGKAKKLHVQLSRLQDKLQGYGIHGAVVSPLDERELLVGDVEDCEAAHINLVLRPDLERIFEVVTGRDWPRARETLIQIFTRQRPGLT